MAAFDNNQTQLEFMKITEDEQIEQVTQEEQDERAVFEESYFLGSGTEYNGGKNASSAASTSTGTRLGGKSAANK